MAGCENKKNKKKNHRKRKASPAFRVRLSSCQEAGTAGLVCVKRVARLGAALGSQAGQRFFSGQLAWMALGQRTLQGHQLALLSSVCHSNIYTYI